MKKQINKTYDEDLEDITKETILLKISWGDYILFYSCVPIKNLNEMLIEVEKLIGVDDLLKFNGKSVFINVPKGFSLNDLSVFASENFELKNNDPVELNDGNMNIYIEKTCAGKTFNKELFADMNKWIYAGISGVAHILLICIFAMYMPTLGINDNEEVNKDNLFLMQQYLKASAEREVETKQTEETTDETKADNKEGGTGMRAKGEEGSMGNPNSRDSNKKYGIAGPKDNQDVHIARMNALRDASTYGMIGLLNTGSGGDVNSPTAPWGRDDSLGADPISARGNMWGNEIGESFGAGGLGLSGIGEGGNGRYEGIGLGSIGTIGHGAGLGDKQGFGNGHGHLNGGHKVKVPITRYGQTVINGRIPPEVVQRIVRQHAGLQKFCFLQGLRSNPNLQGRVTVRFIISREGAVSNASNGGSDLPDSNVVQCVIRSFYGMSFPAPENGIVSIVYPIMFSAQ